MDFQARRTCFPAAHRVTRSVQVPMFAMSRKQRSWTRWTTCGRHVERSRVFLKEAGLKPPVRLSLDGSRTGRPQCLMERYLSGRALGFAPPCVFTRIFPCFTKRKIWQEALPNRCKKSDSSDSTQVGERGGDHFLR